jgi:hypothetical protein
MTRSLAKFLLLVSVLLVAGGVAMVWAFLYLFSFDGQKVGFAIRNQTDRTLNISYVDSGGERVVVHGIGPGQMTPVEAVNLQKEDGYCTTGILVARDSSGAEVARRTEPICNHEQWVNLPGLVVEPIR